MIKWLADKCQSVKLRLILAFFLFAIVIFSILGLYLERILSAEKHSQLTQQLTIQSEVFVACIESTSEVSVESLDHCASFQSHLNPHTNLFLYNSSQEIIWQFKQRSTSLSNSKKSLSLAYSEWLQPSLALLKIADHYYFSHFLDGGYMLVLSIHEQWLNTQVNANRWQLALTLMLIIVALLGGFAVIIHRGLKPLSEMVLDLDEIATGNSDQLKNGYASEFYEMSKSLNSLLKAERIQREKYRNTLANLAHSLKTPLAVMQGAVSENLDYQAYLDVVSEQIRRMDQIIQYQLTRAVKSIGDGAKTNSVLVTPIIERILSALGKVYREKEVRVILNIESGVELNADERDLMEMLGNMLENAFKYCRSEVAISLYSDPDNVYIDLEDDGAGVSEGMRNTILERGERADTSTAPGQGIGLSVSVDILSAYNCRLEVEDSFSLGGAKFSITFPKN
ncbi:MAG: ATP-binding protein [Oceanospirillaceae bacterium]